jgi:hypothetical protein
MIPAVHPRATNVGGLLRYLFGPGKREEHTDAHLVAAWIDAGSLADLEPPALGDGRRDVRALTGQRVAAMAPAVGVEQDSQAQPCRSCGAAGARAAAPPSGARGRGTGERRT